MKEEHSSHTVPISQIIKEIPDILGIRLEKGAAYEVITANDGVEIRSYKSTQMASMTINGSFEKAKKEAFESMTKYLYGKNKFKKKLPVQTLIEPTNYGWTVSFFLPNEFNHNSLPRPKDKRIHLLTRPASTVASLRYSGTNSKEKIKRYSSELMHWVEKNHLYDSIGSIQSAEYDGPSTISFLRKNEVLIEVNGN